MKLHRDLDINQRSAWFLAHRLRVALAEKGGVFSGLVEVDETCFGGLRRNLSNRKRKDLADTGRGAVGKVAVGGIKDRETSEVKAQVVNATDQKTLHPFIEENVKKGVKIYMDEATVYDSLPCDHKAVKYSLSECVKGDVHTNGMESLWSMLKRAYKGTFHKLSPKHLNRYVHEFAGKHNLRDLDTLAQMRDTVARLVGRDLLYRDLIRCNGLPDSGQPCP